MMWTDVYHMILKYHCTISGQRELVAFRHQIKIWSFLCANPITFDHHKEIHFNGNRRYLYIIWSWVTKQETIHFLDKDLRHNDTHVTSLFHSRATMTLTNLLLHYDDVIMTMIASQIISLTSVYSAVYSDADQRKHQSSASLAFVWGIHRDRWIPRTKGQLRGKCFHLMTSSWSLLIPARSNRWRD